MLTKNDVTFEIEEIGEDELAAFGGDPGGAATEDSEEEDDEDEDEDGGGRKKKEKAPDYSKMGIFEVVSTIHRKLPNLIGQASRSKGAVLRRFWSGIYAIDAALKGGWPWGRFCRVIGPSSKGKTSLVLKSIASAQHYCRYCRFMFLPDDNGELVCLCPPRCDVCDESFKKRELSPEEREALIIRKKKRTREGKFVHDPEGEIIFDFHPFFDDHLCGCLDSADKPIITERAGPVRTAFCDIENTFTQDWSSDLGINNDLVILVVPEYAEQAIDLVGILVQSNQVDLVAIDSLAAMTPSAEVEASAEDNQMGVAARKINRAFRTWASAINKLGLTTQNKPTVLIINQVREKIASRFNPGGGETEPGGRAQVFHSSIDVRVNATYKNNNKGNAVFARTRFFIKKNKTGPAGIRGKYDFYYKARPDHPVGDTNEYAVVMDMAFKFGILEKKGPAKYIYGRKVFKTQKLIQELLERDIRFFQEVRERTLEADIGKKTERRAEQALLMAATQKPAPEPEESADDGSSEVGGEGAQAAPRRKARQGSAETGADGGASDSRAVPSPWR